MPGRREVLLRATLEHGDPGDAVIEERDGLSPDEATLAAVDRNPLLRAIRARRGLARAEIVTAGLLPNPRLEGSLSAPTGGPDARVLGYGVGLAWNVTPLLAHPARVRAAEQRARSVDLEVAWQEWQVAQSARLHTIRLIYLARQVSVARQAAESWRERMDAYRVAREALATTELQAARVERSQAEWELRRQDLERQQIVERSELAQALGVESSRLPELQATWRPQVHDPVAPDLLADLPRRRLDLVALQYARRSRGEALRAAMLARFPPIEVGMRASREVDGAQSVAFALRVALPVFDRNQGEVAHEAARGRQLEEESEARLAQARSQTRRSVQELSLLREQLDTARRAATSAVRLATLARISARSGGLDPSLAADRQDDAYRARLRALRTEETYAEVQVALSISSGALVR